MRTHKLLLLSSTDAPGAAEPDQDKVTVKEEDDTTLTCTFTGGDKGVPVGWFTWTRGGSPRTGGRDGTLTITDASVEDDDGEYQCTPTNDIGSGTPASIDVEVQSEWPFCW